MNYLVRGVIAWARKMGWAHTAELELEKGDGSYPLGYGVANLVLNVVKKKFGLQCCDMCLTGAAPVTPETLRFLGGLGLPLRRWAPSYGASKTPSPGSFALCCEQTGLPNSAHSAPRLRRGSQHSSAGASQTPTDRRRRAPGP